MDEKRIYLQQASFRMSGAQLSFREQIQAAARMGYAGLELAGGMDGLTAAEARRLLDGCGIRALGAHIALAEMDARLAELQTLGAAYAIVPNALMRSREETLRLAQALNAQGRRMAARGIAFGYHNHNTEFRQEAGAYLLQTLLDHTDPEYVFLEYDVGWAAASGADCLAFLQKNAARIRLLHVNESDTVLGPGVGRPVQEIPRDAAGQLCFTPEEEEYNVRRKRCDCPLGRGIPDWPRILQAGSAVQAYIVERRWSYLPDPCACFAEDLAYLKTLQRI